MAIIDSTVTGVFQNASVGGVAGRYPVIDATKVGMWGLRGPPGLLAVRERRANYASIDTTELAAIAAWEILQGFYSALPQLDSEVQSKQFNLWTGLRLFHITQKELYKY